MRIEPNVRDKVIWRKDYDHPHFSHWLPGVVIARIGYDLLVRCADDKLRDIPDSWLAVKNDSSENNR